MKADRESANLTQEFAQRVCAVTFDSLDQATVAGVKRLIADAIAVAIAGSRERAPTIIAEHIRDIGAKPQASVWSFAFKTTPAHAAYANAASMHVLDFEPMSNPPTHAVSPTTALATIHTLEASPSLSRDYATTRSPWKSANGSSF